jgi:antitoxin component HigA of HigAB toxin-antitoxin module
MALTEISPLRYGKLLAKIQPKVIESRAEFDRYVGIMEQLDRDEARRTLSPEEVTLRSLLEQLVKDYDDRVELPDLEPYKVVLHLMAHRALEVEDLVPVFGTRAAASAVLSGRRAFTTGQIRKLAEFFRVSAEAFL